MLPFAPLSVLYKLPGMQPCRCQDGLAVKKNRCSRRTSTRWCVVASSLTFGGAFGANQRCAQWDAERLILAAP